MNENHLNFLTSIVHEAQGNVGRNAIKFGNKVQSLEILPEIVDQQFNRDRLFELCKNEKYSNLTLTIAILAWGGMRFDHARDLFEQWNNLDPIIQKLRTGEIQTRFDAFKILQNTRANGQLPGLGIGYFTKLICFLNPNLKGYILDQWTGKSINLLTGRELIKISSIGWVTDKNSPEIYGEFCEKIEQLSTLLEIEPIKVEELLFSKGGRHPGMWRKYLNINYPNN